MDHKYRPWSLLVLTLVIAACGRNDIEATSLEPETTTTVPAPRITTTTQSVLEHDPPMTVVMNEADALTALSARVEELASIDQFAGAVLVAKDGQVLFSHASGLADREGGIPNTLQTRFRIG